MRSGGLSLALALAVGTVALAAACGGSDEEPTKPPVIAQAEAGVDAEGGAPAALCEGGKPTVDYPPGPYDVSLLSVLPKDLAWTGPDGKVLVKDYFEPCAARSRLLVIRTSAAWCGTCQWHASHTKKLLGDPRFADRVLLLDLVVADRDNMPATEATAAAWKTAMDAPSKVAIDPAYVLSKVLSGRGPLPEYVFVDTKTMVVRTVDSDPDPETLATKILVELAALDKAPRPPAIDRVLYDDYFTANEWDLIQGMKLVAAPPPDPTNEVADRPEAIAFGKTLFSDKLLTPSGTVSCESCHDATKHFTDATAQSTGLSRVDRNSPSVALAAHSRWQFWDGRADTLWMQALGPPENAKEMGSSRLFIAHRIASAYAAEYDAIFGAKYPRPDLTGLPASGKPGDAAYDALPAATKDAITRVYVNVGKSIAAFERSLRVLPNAIDRYAEGDKTALGDGEKKALQAYFKLGCAQCHWGPRLTDDAFHALRFPTGRQDGALDKGRLEVLPTLASGEFVATSKWSDAPSAAKVLALPAAPTMLGAFKTPPLRGVADTAPYGHGGMLATLFDVSKHYGTRGKDVATTSAGGEVEVWAPEFDANVQALLPDILRAMKAEIAP